MGASDYLALVSKYHTVCLEGVPVVTPDNKSAAYRFVTLVDVLYESRARLLCSAAELPGGVFGRVMTHEDFTELRRLEGDRVDDGSYVVDDNLGFVKDRTVSRLTEMGSLEYLRGHAEIHAPQLMLAIREAMDRRRASA